jgi:serine/threonine-protein kinase ULK/ATG1
MVKRCGYDAKVDLWSVGVIFFECLFGKAPYKSANMEELVRKIREEHPIEIPSSPHLSDACHDLLTRMLCTDPTKRIDFEEFFAHPFIDLEHMPSDESLAKAISLAEEAVRLDTAGKLAEALERYKRALEYFVPLANNERSATKREALKKRTTEYIRRAEQIKVQLDPNGSCTLKAKLQKRTNSENEAYDELFILSAGTPKLITALDIAKAAEAYELEGKYPVALEKYQTSLGMLLPLLSNEPAGKRKTMLHSEITRWMNKAECIKDMLNIQEKVLADSLASDAGSDKQCSIQ